MNTSPTLKNPIIRWMLLASVVMLAAVAVVMTPGIKQHLPFSGLSGEVRSVLGTLEILETPDHDILSSGQLELPLVNGEYAPSYRFVSDTFSVDTFMASAVQWKADQPAGTKVSLEMRVGRNDIWTTWRTLDPSEDAQARGRQELEASDPWFVPESTSVQIAAILSTNSIDATPVLTNLKLHFINTADGPSAAQARASIQATSQTNGQPTIISRAAWGANESWMTWSPQYVDVDALITHHTAGSDGGNDPAAVVRGIYFYHAVTLGWGDIGYNYIIDATGNIYEGRSGGERVIGGHALGYNDGSAGIALLGTYDNVAPTSAAKQALATLSGYLSARYDLNPTASIVFQGSPNFGLAGHRDYNSTACPGTVLHGDLGEVRTNALSARDSFLGGDYAGSLSSISGNIIAPNKPGTASVLVKNTGTATWTSSGGNPVVLATSGPEGHKSSLYTQGWVSDSEAAYMLQSVVAPGQTATFKVPFGASGLGDISDTFSLYRKHIAPIAGTSLTLTRSVRPAYQGQVVSSVDPILVEGGTRTEIDLRIKNTGSHAWSSTGDSYAALNLINPKGRSSLLYDASWPLAYRPTVMDTATVAPEQTGIFRFTVDVPAKTSDHLEAMQPVIEGVQFIDGAAATLRFVVSNPLQSELLERPVEIILPAGSTKNVSVSFANYSGQTWKPTGVGYIALEGVGLGSGSILRANSWVSNIRPAAVPHEVGPGSAVQLNFRVHAPTTPGTYIERYQLVSDGSGQIDGSSFDLTVVVRPAYSAKIIKAPGTVTVQEGDTARATLVVENTGATTWVTDQVLVVTDKPLQHASDFAAPSWESAGTASIIEPNVVAPNQRATVSIEISAGAVGTASENFTLMAMAKGSAVAGSAFSITRKTTAVPNNNPAGPLGENIRVGITSGASIKVGSGTSYTVRDASGATLGSAASGDTTVTWSGGSYQLSGAVTGSTVHAVRVEPGSNTILSLPDYEDRPGWNPSLNDNTFRGVMEVRRNSDGKLYAINELSLELYMRGLAEASNGDDQTYLQILTVAARTYAEYHRSNGGKHADLGYDLDNKNDQVYKGYGFEQRSADITAAVEATKGTFVRHGGTIVVTPYFSQSDGRTRSFAEVWGGAQKPWLVSVSVPENSGKTLLGHGVGLDASAARVRAIAGQSRDTVLKSFYTGVSIDKLY